MSGGGLRNKRYTILDKMLRLVEEKTERIVIIDDATIDEMVHALNWARKERARCRAKDARRATGNPPGRPVGWKKGVNFCVEEKVPGAV